MGYRTTVILFNDHSHEWQNDHELGRKIAHAGSMKLCRGDSDLRFGRVIECEHADTQTVMVLDSYNGTPIVHSHWRPEDTAEARDMRLLREWADKLGYVLYRKPSYVSLPPTAEELDARDK